MFNLLISRLTVVVTLFASLPQLALAAPPTIQWTTNSGAGANPFSGPINPTLIVPGETYMIRAQGADADGNLAAVSINKNGQPFAYAGGGNGSAYISNNPSTDSGVTTFTAWATDGNGNTSPTIKLTVYPKRKYVGAFYAAWWVDLNMWNGSWGGAGVIPTQLGRYLSTQATGAGHAQKLKQLGVDFIAIDSTNNTIWGPAHPDPTYHNDWIFANAKAVVSGFGSSGMKAVMLLSIGNSQGGGSATERLLTQNYSTANPPFMAYPSIPSNAGDLFRAKVARVYNEMANDPTKYFYYEGKPLLLLYTTASGAIFGPNNQNHTLNGKLEGSDLAINIPGVAGNPLLTDLFTIRWVGAFVSNSNNTAYVDTSLGYPNQTIAKNGNWSWEDAHPQSWARKGTGWLNDVFPEAMTVTAYSRGYGFNAEATRQSGATFLTQWGRVHAVDPLFAILHTWNEFSGSGDEPSVERSQSIEANNFFGNTYETYFTQNAAFFRRLRFDVGLYNVSNGTFYLYNRKGDYTAPTTPDFGSEQQVTMYRGPNVETIAGDFNRDGLYEIGLRNKDNGTIAIRFSPRYNVGGDADAHAEVVITLDVGQNWRAFAVDFNSDGFCDIALYDITSKVFKFYTNSGSYSFSFSHQFTWNVGTNAQLTSADINGDRLGDIVVRDTSTGTYTFGLNNGDNLSATPTRVYTMNWVPGSHYQMYAADFTGDGAAEIGMRDSSIGRFYFLQNTKTSSGSNWNFTNQTTYDPPGPLVGGNYLPLVGDFR